MNDFIQKEKGPLEDLIEKAKQKDGYYFINHEGNPKMPQVILSLQGKLYKFNQVLEIDGAIHNEIATLIGPVDTAPLP